MMGDAIALAALLLACGTWGFFGAALLGNRKRTIVLAPRAASMEGPLVSVVLPVRDEAHQIEGCIQSLLAQDYPALEIVTIDDRSEDGTGAILERLARQDERVRVVAGEDLPDGWVGKSWAVHQGVSRARGEWIFFTDADALFEPQALTAVLDAVTERQLDMLTGLPAITCESFWERVLMPAIIITALGGNPIKNLENPRWPHTVAYGPLILMRRETYDRVGGHEAVRFEIVEDIALAEAAKAKGARIGYASAVDVARVRMYTSLPEIWRGFTKNFFGGVHGNPALALVGIATWLVAGVFPWLALPIDGWAWLHGGAFWPTGAIALLAGLTLLVFLAQAIPVYRRVCGLNPIWTLATPLAFSLIAGIMANSAFRCLIGAGPRWKGRNYSGMYRLKTP